MLGVDTNIPVRLIANDDPAQAAIARKLLEQNELYLSLLTLAETEWVLRSIHGFSRYQTTDALLALFELENIVVEHEQWARWALARHHAGADLADMILLVMCRDTAEFATFDGGIELKAGPDAPVPVRTLRA